MPTIYSKEKLGKDRVIGFYDTPPKTVAYICKSVLEKYIPGQSICDPAVGDGVFLKYLLSKGVRKSDLYGFDIDKDKVNSLSKNFPNVTFYDSTNPFKRSFNYIVGNPPYNGDDSHWVRENRERLAQNSKEIGGPKNTYSIISYNAIRALADDGLFCMILSDSFLTNVYYTEFRFFLLKSLQLHQLLLAPRKLFFQKAADVRTVIISGTKVPFKLYLDAESIDSPPLNGCVQLIDRVQSEDEYINPKNVEFIPQSSFSKYPNSSFLIGIPNHFRSLYLNSKCRLGDLVEGGTGISTGNDKRFLRLKGDVSGDPEWVPYYKNGARNAYYYSPNFYIHRDYKKSSSLSKTYMIRNERFFFRKGITCASVGVRFSASYMPEGGLFGVNANFFCKDPNNIYYLLGILNSKVAWYFCRRILIRTNNISANYLRLMPIIMAKPDTFKRISETTYNIIELLKKDPATDYQKLQDGIDKMVFDIYECDLELINHVNDFCNNFYDRM